MDSLSMLSFFPAVFSSRFLPLKIILLKSRNGTYKCCGATPFTFTAPTPLIFLYCRCKSLNDCKELAWVNTTKEFDRNKTSPVAVFWVIFFVTKSTLMILSLSLSFCLFLPLFPPFSPFLTFFLFLSLSLFPFFSLSLSLFSISH